MKQLKYFLSIVIFVLVAISLVNCSSTVSKPTETLEWQIYNSNYKTLKGIKYPIGFYIDDESAISIRSSELPLVQGGTDNCAFTPPCALEGLQISIGYTKTPSPEFLIATDYPNIKKEKADENEDESMPFQYDIFYYIGAKDTYSIQIYEQGFKGDYKNIVEEILKSLHE